MPKPKRFRLLNNEEHLHPTLVKIGNRYLELYSLWMRNLFVDHVYQRLTNERAIN
jgi:hypothetical protein